MAKFLDGEALHARVEELLREPGVRCAVAFWGNGSEKLITSHGARVICNLKMGGTNPFALQKVNADKRQCDHLHAKVYIGQTAAVVTSANASTNGLGLEGSQQAYWVEAGVLLDDVAAVSTWFEALWEQSRKIKDKDWEAAEKAWQARQNGHDIRPPSTFSDFDETASILPLVTWISDTDWVSCPDSIERELKVYNEIIERRVEDGLELEHPDDEPLMWDRWVLSWFRGKDGLPRKRRRLLWFQLSDVVVKDAYRYAGEKKRRPVVLGVERPSRAPFGVGDTRFVEALSKVLSRDEYARLREDEYKGAWFKPRAELMAKLWRDVKVVYNSSA